MSKSLEDWDRPGPECADPTCNAFRAGIPHRADAAHTEILNTVREIRDMKPPRSLALRAQDLAAQRARRQIAWLMFLTAVVVSGWIVGMVFLLTHYGE